MSSNLMTIYHLLGINRKLPDEGIRFMYLKDKWGMSQSAIGTCENKSQSYVSNVLRMARSSMSTQTFNRAIENIWTSEEIKNFQFIPRTIIGDVAVMAFITDILGVYVVHPFFQHNTSNITYRILALASLGVQNKRIQEIFGKSQSSISMIIKRGGGVDLNKFNKVGRYDYTAEYKLTEKPVVHKFIQAGGSFAW